MRKIILFVILSMGWIYPCSVFAGGNKDHCDLTIENNTGGQITQIIISESESEKKPQTINRSVLDNSSTVIQLKKDVLYDIALVNTNERQFIKKRQVWNDETGNIRFESKDLLNPTIWDKAKEAGRAAAVVGVEAIKTVAGTVEEGYRQMGGDEGAKKAVQALGKFTEAGLKMGIQAGITGGKIIVEVSRYTMERIKQEKMQRLNASERDALDEHVEYVITDDDQ